VAWDVPVRWSCRAGVCHTCETTLVSGTVRDLVFDLWRPVDMATSVSLTGRWTTGPARWGRLGRAKEQLAALPPPELRSAGTQRPRWLTTFVRLEPGGWREQA
jgi:hypothetical protein